MKAKILLAFVMVVSVVTIAAAPQPEQSHNLSEIKPIDVDFNMSRMDIFNVTELDLYSGLTFTGNWINTPGGQNLIGWDLANTQLELKNGNLSLEGNRLVNVGGISGCTGSQLVKGDGGCKSADLSVSDNWVNETGDNMTGNLNMNGNQIKNSTMDKRDCASNPPSRVGQMVYCTNAD
ncbi:MAG: hypothetical protein H8Z69_05575 [Nanohaloarchaea archaeon]|nr:hypothetical protein [Candidatus Nanohaloarchaea archaeon]